MTTILCYGDSNTHGSAPMARLREGSRLPLADRWTSHLRAMLPPEAELIIEGQPGRTTVHDDPIEGAHRNGLTVLPAILESHAPIDLVVLMLGTNDMKARFAVTPLDVALSLERLIGVIRASGKGPGGTAPDVLLISPPPVEEEGCLEGMFTGGAAKSRALASFVAEVAQRTGAGFLDAGPLISVSPLDGVHYDGRAHAVLGAAIGKAVLARLGA